MTLGAAVVKTLDCVLFEGSLWAIGYAASAALLAWAVYQPRMAP
jgi:hypothetical protein